MSGSQLSSPFLRRPYSDVDIDARLDDDAAYQATLARAHQEFEWYMGYVRAGTLGSTMQALGDIGRAFALPLAILYLGYMLSWVWL